MAEHVDLDQVMETLSAGGQIPLEDIVSMRNELCAWRAAHEAGAVVVTTLRGSQPPLVTAAVEAYRAAVEGSMAALGYPQGVAQSAPPESLGLVIGCGHRGCSERVELPPSDEPIAHQISLAPLGGWTGTPLGWRCPDHSHQGASATKADADKVTP